MHYRKQSNKFLSVCMLPECVQKQRLHLHRDSESREPMSEDPLRLFLQFVILSWFNRDGSQLEGRNYIQPRLIKTVFYDQNLNVVQRINKCC